MAKRTYNPCDDCKYNFSYNNQECLMCKICEFKQLLDEYTTDVVPKSEVEKQKLEIWRLQGEVERLEKENEKLTINMNAYSLAAKRLAEEKADVARLQEDVDRLNEINEHLVKELAKAREQINVMKRAEELDKIPTWG